MRNPLIPVYDMPAVLDYPSIDPVPNDVQRPFWSVMIPTYNRPDYLKETLESILIQAPPPDEMQIMVVDNASTLGDIRGIVQKVGQGRVEYHRQPKNIGLNGNWTSCLQLSRGHYVHMMHDDDFVIPRFYDVYRQHIEGYGCNVMFCQSIFVDDERRWYSLSRQVYVENGVVAHPLHILFQSRTFNVNSLVASRDLYEQVGGYLPDLHHGCDYEICARLLEAGTVGFTDRPYIMTRQHQEQDSRKNLGKSCMMHDYLWSFQSIIRNHNTPNTRRLIYNGLRDTLYDASCDHLYLGNFRNATYLAIWAFRSGPNLNMMIHIISISYKRWLGIPMRRFYSLVRRIKHLVTHPRQISA